MLLKHLRPKVRDFPQQILEFTLGDQRFGFEISRILEVVIPRQITPVPGGNCFFLGMINVRGHVLPLTDIRTKLGITTPSPEKPAHAIIFEIAGLQVGIVADTVAHKLRETSDGKIESHLEGSSQELVYFSLEKEDVQIRVLKTDSLLSTEEVALLERTTRAFVPDQA